MNTKVAILTSKDQWFVPYAKVLKDKIPGSKLFYDHEVINESYDIVFVLSYYNIIEGYYLRKHRHNIVIHASALPKGKGWSPLFWQVLEDKSKIPFTMFEASTGIDDGDIHMQKTLVLTGYELNDELREKEAKVVIEMCLEFLNNYDKYKIPKKQKGTESYYPRRIPKDSQFDINKTIYEQFNLFRIVNNDKYPAFFIMDGKKYVLKIKEEKNEN